MCGIVGVLGSINQRDKKVFTELLTVDLLRGKDSTGVVSVNASYKSDWWKTVGDSASAIEQEAYEEIVESARFVLLGHNRFATLGKVSADNAHPFEKKHITGVHNGTLTNRTLLSSNHKFEVDSENIIYHLSEKGVESLSEAINLYGNSYALVWYDSNERSMNFLRNEHRPLWLAYSTCRTTLYWASEKGLLTWILDRNRVNYQPPFSLNPHELLTVVPPETGRVLSDIKTKKLERESYSPWYGESAYGSSINNISFLYDTAEVVQFKVTNVPASKKQQHLSGVTVDNCSTEVRVYQGQLTPPLHFPIGTILEGVVGTVHDRGYLLIKPSTVKEVQPFESTRLLGYNKEELTSSEFVDKTSCGCAWCSDVPSEAESQSLTWISSTDFVCELCMELDEVKEYVG